LRPHPSNSPPRGAGIATSVRYIRYPPKRQSFHVLEVVEVNSLYQLTAYRLGWSKLLTGTRAATFFQTLDWLDVYWRHFGSGQELRTLVVKSDRREILGILPLVVRHERSAAGWVRVVGYPLDGCGTFYGPIGPNPMLTLAVRLSYIAHTPRDWDLFDLSGVDSDYKDDGRTALAFHYAEMPARKSTAAQSAWIELDQGWDAYWQSRLCDWRITVQKAEQQLSNCQVKYIRYRPRGRASGDDDPRWDLYRACEQISEQTSEARSHEFTPPSSAYFRDLHAAAVKAGGVDMNLLLLNGSPAAFAYNLHYRGRVNVMRIGFDASASNHDALSVLLLHMLRDSCHRGDTLLDLGAQAAQCARHWTTRIATAYRYTHCPLLAVKAQLLRAQQWLKRSLAIR
jgi:Acetyltransferase (GNAT) domain